MTDGREPRKPRKPSVAAVDSRIRPIEAAGPSGPDERVLERRRKTAERVARHRDRNRDKPNPGTIDREIALFFVDGLSSSGDADAAVDRLRSAVVGRFVAAGYDRSETEEAFEGRLRLLGFRAPSRPRLTTSGTAARNTWKNTFRRALATWRRKGAGDR